MNKTLKLYQKISKLPFGNYIFTKGLTIKAPYFSSIKPLITELRTGFCSVKMKDRKAVRNHINSINAGAMCTLSELVGGLAFESTISSDLRWIPKKMTVSYMKKARGTLTATCSFDPNIIKKGDITIPFEIKDKIGDVVIETEIVFFVR